MVQRCWGSLLSLFQWIQMVLQVELLSILAFINESATFANNDTTMGTLEEAVAESHTLVNKEEEDLERSISNIIEVQMKEIQDKIVKFEEVESQMEREWKQLHQMKNLLFADQLTLLFRRTKSPLKIGESTKGVVQITDAAAVT